MSGWLYLHVWAVDGTMSTLRFDDDRMRSALQDNIKRGGTTMVLVTSERGRSFWLRPSSVIRMEHA